MHRKKRILIEPRNREVKTALRTWFRDKTGVKDPLPVFCVSTTGYMELIKEDENRSLLNPSEFTPESTEIVALRRHLFTMVNKRGQEQSMTNYYRLVKHLLNEMSLAYTDFKPMYRRDHLLTFIEEVRKTVPEQGRAHRHGFIAKLQPINDLSNTSMKEWIRRAKGRCDKCGSYNGISHWAYLKCDGVHKRPHGKMEDWSRTLSDIATTDLEPLLITLCVQGCDTFGADLVYALQETMEKMERDIRSNLDPTSIKLFSEFLENLQLDNKAIGVLVRKVVGTLKDGFL